MSFTPDLCPFKMMALGLRHGGRIYVEGGKAMREQDVDLACVGPTCMAFIKTNVRPDGQPIGGCGIAVAPSITKELDRRMERLENTINHAVAYYLRPVWYLRLWEWCRVQYTAWRYGREKGSPASSGFPLAVIHPVPDKETPP